MLVYSIPEKKRDVRAELRKQLSWLGYGPLSSGSWVCPHEVQSEVQELATRLGISGFVERFTASHDGFSDDAALAARCWDLEGINARYDAFIERYRPRYESFKRRRDVEDAECFVQRFSLLHEYRKFFFIDPDLPRELLPEGWKGIEARELFHEFHTLLAEPANRFFDSVLEVPTARRRRSARELAATAIA
jgi:phenylacetic acid degradation operon negative regulatory protein